ncbi:glucosyltransferase [Mycena floridula]|nr:glucosyltransferase [Mycena floridula]
MSSSSYYVVFCGLCITVLKEFNTIVLEPYMDEPFHIPQAQAYCRGDFATWDPKLTTPPGLYLMSVLMKRIFMFKCNVAMLRLTTTLNLLALPLVMSRLISFHKRIRPPPLLSPLPESIVLALFPIVWFFGFLYYTETPSVLFVLSSIVAATDDKHWLAALLGLASCSFRQTNIIWVLYAYGLSQLIYLRFRRATPGTKSPAKLHDPPAVSARPNDIWKALLSLPDVLPDILPSFIPYALVLAVFGAFVVWNGGIVLGDKSNHIPSFHVPQVYYFVAFTTAFGWPVLISSPGGIRALLREVQNRMFGSKSRTLVTTLILAGMSFTVNRFTIHHPFLLSDNRHYTFYVWRRIFMFHPTVPYLLTPVYLACTWAWFLRAGHDATLLQMLLLPVLTIFTLLPTPLLEPRYFLVPYILLRSQITDLSGSALILEGVWYTAINIATMGIFLYLPREAGGEVLRFMW